VTAGSCQQLVHPVKVRLQEARVLRAAAGVGQERSFHVDTRDESIVGQQAQGYQAHQQIFAWSRHQTGQQRGGTAAVHASSRKFERFKFRQNGAVQIRQGPNVGDESVNYSNQFSAECPSVTTVPESR